MRTGALGCAGGFTEAWGADGGARGGSYDMGSGRAAAAVASRRGRSRESTSRRVGAPFSTVAPPARGER